MSSTLTSAISAEATTGLENIELAPPAVMPADNRRLQVFRYIAAPLMAAVAGASATHPGMDDSLDSMAVAFTKLMDATVALDRHVVSALELDEQVPSARWLAAESIANLVSSYYLSTGSVLSSSDAGPIIDALKDTLSSSPDFGTEGQPQSDPESVKTLKALTPAIIAVAQFSFGRNALELIREVTQKLIGLATEISARLSGIDGNPVNKSDLYIAVLEITGEFYKASHFSEMERFIQMAPEERRAYVAQHNRKIPMEPVWELLEIRLAMLEAVAGYLPQPGGKT